MGIGEGDPKIYATQQIHGKNREWMEQDVFKRLQGVAAKGFKWDSNGLVLRQMGEMSMNPNTPWCHAKGHHELRCSVDHHIIWEGFGIITPRCQNCWKVCLGLPDFKSLMRMKEIQEDWDIAAKCGAEVRDYTPKTYGAYFYNIGIDEGRDKYEQVVKVVKENFENGEEIAKGVILKRGCTEYEMIKGPSPYWCNTDKELEILEMIEAYTAFRKSNLSQYPMIKRYVMQNWILWAHSHGDFSYLPWNGGKKLFPDYVTYHEGDILNIKNDLRMAKEAVLHPQPQGPAVIEPVEFDKDLVGDDDGLT